MLKNLTKDLTTAVHSTIPVITNIASSQDSLLQDVSQIISSNTSKIISNTNPLETNNTISSNISKPLTTITNTNPLETIKSISSNISSPLTTITNSLVNPLNNLVNPISLATSFLRKVQQLVLGSTQITFPPSWYFRFTVILVLAGLISSIFMPLIILTSPIWIPTATLFFLFTAMFLSACGFVVAVVTILYQAYSYYMRRHPQSK